MGFYEVSVCVFLTWVLFVLWVLYIVPPRCHAFSANLLGQRPSPDYCLPSPPWLSKIQPHISHTDLQWVSIKPNPRTDKASILAVSIVFLVWKKVSKTEEIIVETWDRMRKCVHVCLREKVRESRSKKQRERERENFAFSARIPKHFEKCCWQRPLELITFWLLASGNMQRHSISPVWWKYVTSTQHLLGSFRVFSQPKWRGKCERDAPSPNGWFWDARSALRMLPPHFPMCVRSPMLRQQVPRIYHIPAPYPGDSVANRLCQPN
jgi:hypothetical protein